MEPWNGGSHARWADGYRAASRHVVSSVGLPADRWRWRQRGGAAPLADLVRGHVADHGRPDVVVISSPVDAARLLGLLRNDLAGVPVAVYQHESQLLYPNAKGAGANDADALLDWFSWLAVDAVFFNSDWHRRQVIRALPPFLDRLPDRDHHHLLEAVLDKFETLPLGLDLSWTEPSSPPSSPRSGPIVLWPHRWEPDKEPAVFARAVDRLVDRRLDVGLVLAGEAGPFGDPIRQRLVDAHADRVLAVGPFSPPEYRYWLGRSDIVVSCAAHDFFGVAVAEAVAAGCVPVVPDAVNYPDLLGPGGADFLYRPGTFGSRLAEVVGEVDRWQRRAVPLAATMQRFDWSELAPVYDRRMAMLAER